MANVIVNGNTYNGIQTVKLPLAEDASRFAYFNYDHSDEGGGGDFTPKITLEEGSYTVSGCKIAVSGNTVSVSNPKNQTVVDISRITTNTGSTSYVNCANKQKLFSFKNGDTVRIVATFSTVIEPTETYGFNSTQLFRAYDSSDRPWLLAENASRTGNVFSGEQVVEADVDIGAISLGIGNLSGSYTVEVKLYVNDERWL